MPKTKKSVVKSTKQKLSPAARSQVAKDRWAKRRGNFNTEITKVAPQEATDVVETAILSDTPNASATLTNGVVTAVTITNGVPPPAEPIFYTPPVEVTPVPPKKQKKYTGPKEFSVALKAAENRLAKAINERAEAMGKLAGLNAEIPSLLGIINALKGSGNYAPPAPYDFSGSVPNAQAFQTPLQQPQFQNGPDLAAIQAAMDAAQVAIPVSRATGGGMQFSPEVVGTLEGPDDDDNEDRYLTGPLAGGGWK